MFLHCSKFKVLEPTRLSDLIKHSKGGYKEIPFRDLEHISEGDLVKVQPLPVELQN